MYTIAVLWINLSTGDINAIHSLMQYCIGPICCLAFAFWYAPRYFVNRKVGFLFELIVFVPLTLSIFVYSWVMSCFGQFVGFDSVIAFLIMIPCAYIFARRFKISPMQGVDFMILVSLLHRGIGMIGCIVADCSMGIPVSFGIYSHSSHQYVFPTTIIDCLSSLLVWAIGFCYAKKKHYTTNGKVYVLTLLIHGVCRYCLQFLSAYPAYYPGFNIRSIYSMLEILIALITLYFIENPIRIKKKKALPYFDIRG